MPLMYLLIFSIEYLPSHQWQMLLLTDENSNESHQPNFSDLWRFLLNQLKIPKRLHIFLCKMIWRAGEKVIDLPWYYHFYCVPNLQSGLPTRLRVDYLCWVLHSNCDIVVVEELTFDITSYQGRFSYSLFLKSLPWWPTNIILKFSI
jgi:hypothetical protein